MPENATAKQPIGLLKMALHTLFQNPVIFFPFIIIVFVQLLLLELVFFAPRYPLSLFFKPIITKLAGDIFMHYPYNFFLLSKWFQKVQIPLFIFVNSLFIGCAISIINALNNERTVKFRDIFRKTLPLYIHLMLAALCSVGVLLGISKLYGLLVKRAFLIRSTSGIYFIIKKIVIVGAPYFNLLFAIFVTTLFAFVMPIIIVERKKIFSALILNFKTLWGSVRVVLPVVFLTSLLYVPVFLFKSSTRLFQEVLAPEALGVMMVVSILITLFIDTIQITAITMYYLLKKEI